MALQIIKKMVSCNFSDRTNYPICRIVLHTFGAIGNSCFNWFNNPKSQASAHYAVLFDGKIEQYVEEEKMAWHAGTKYNPNNNLFCIGIECQDNGKPEDSTRTPELYESVSQLVADICKRRDIPCKLVRDKNGNGIALHRMYDPGRSCPGGLDVERIIKRANEILKSV